MLVKVVFLQVHELGENLGFLVAQETVSPPQPLRPEIQRASVKALNWELVSSPLESSFPLLSIASGRRGYWLHSWALSGLVL